jgi:hypothetical protein
MYTARPDVCRMSMGMLEPVRPRKDVMAEVRRVEVVRGSRSGCGRDEEDVGLVEGGGREGAWRARCR